MDDIVLFYHHHVEEVHWSDTVAEYICLIELDLQ